MSGCSLEEYEDDNVTLAPSAPLTSAKSSVGARDADRHSQIRHIADHLFPQYISLGWLPADSSSVFFKLQAMYDLCSCGARGRRCLSKSGTISLCEYFTV